MICSKCNSDKLPEQMVKENSKSGISSTCKECKNKLAREKSEIKRIDRLSAKFGGKEWEGIDNNKNTKCNKCGIVKTNNSFTTNTKRGKKVLRTECNECRSKRRKEKSIKERNLHGKVCLCCKQLKPAIDFKHSITSRYCLSCNARKVIINGMVKCTKCLENKNPDEMKKASKELTGLLSTCKDCHAKQSREYRKVNRELRLKVEETYRNNRGVDVVKQMNKEWKSRNPEKVRSYWLKRFTVKRDYYIQRSQKERDDLCDNYVRGRIKSCGKGMFENHSEIPDVLVEAKRETLIIYRLVRKLKENINEEHNI